MPLGVEKVIRGQLAEGYAGRADDFVGYGRSRQPVTPLYPGGADPSIERDTRFGEGVVRQQAGVGQVFENLPLVEALTQASQGFFVCFQLIPVRVANS